LIQDRALSLNQLSFTVGANLHFIYKGEVLEIVNTFTYLGIVFTVGGSFNKTYETLAGQAWKAIYKMRTMNSRFPGMTIK